MFPSFHLLTSEQHTAQCPTFLLLVSATHSLFLVSLLLQWLVCLNLLAGSFPALLLDSTPLQDSVYNLKLQILSSIQMAPKTIPLP